MLSENPDSLDTFLSVPCSIEAEHAIIGSLLLEPETVLSSVQEMKSDYFYDAKCSAIFDVVMIMYTQGLKIDAITVLNSAMMHGVFETEQEGRNYINAITENITSVANIDSHCTIVAEKYRIRALMKAAKDILQNISTNAYSAQQLIDSAEQNIFNIREGKNIEGLTPLKDFIFTTYEHIANLAGPDRESYLGAKTGFAPLDTMITGLNKSDLIIVAARPGMGKTSFAMNIALHVAKHNRDSKVAVFNLEMPKIQLASRLLSTEACVESHKMRTGRIDPKTEWIKLAQATQVLAEVPILIDDTSSITVQQMKAKLRRVKNLGLVIIDYLQLISTTLRTDSRVSIVAEITRQLKIMAKELDVPVILLSQLSRSPESRTDKRPLLSDLRDSGAIEQDADIVLFLYRDGYYNKDSKTPNISECIVAKNRHGETGKVELYWDGQYTRFSVVEKHAQPD